MTDRSKPSEEELYIKARESAAHQVIEESMMRKIGRQFPQGYKSLNPVREGHTDNKYDPLRW